MSCLDEQMDVFRLSFDSPLETFSFPSAFTSNSMLNYLWGSTLPNIAPDVKITREMGIMIILVYIVLPDARKLRRRRAHDASEVSWRRGGQYIPKWSKSPFSLVIKIREISRTCVRTCVNWKRVQGIT